MRFAPVPLAQAMLLAALLAACSGNSGSSTGGGGAGVPQSASGWRPFSADSPWNTPIPANPPLQPDTNALITDFANSSPWGVHLDVNIAGYSIPLYWADSATPTYPVVADRVGGEGWGSGLNYQGVSAQMPIPDGAAPDPQSDHHLLVVDVQRGIEWGCWDVTLQGPVWRGGVCATADLLGSGVRPPFPATTEPRPPGPANPWWRAVGARACGFPLVAGLIRVSEIEAGRIDHALVVAYPHIEAGFFTPPASTGQGANGVGAQKGRGIPCGGRIQFDPAVDLSTLGLSRSGLVIMRALQEYGAYVGDFSGALSLYAENSPAAQAYWSSEVLDSYELQGKIDLTRFRVLQYGPVYDNGNGD
jgi:hypothetical protein